MNFLPFDGCVGTKWMQFNKVMSSNEMMFYTRILHTLIREDNYLNCISIAFSHLIVERKMNTCFSAFHNSIRDFNINEDFNSHLRWQIVCQFHLNHTVQVLVSFHLDFYWQFDFDSGCFYLSFYLWDRLDMAYPSMVLLMNFYSLISDVLVTMDLLPPEAYYVSAHKDCICNDSKGLCT